MIIGIHALRRLGYHGLVPKKSSGQRRKAFIKNQIQKHIKGRRFDRETGATIIYTEKLIAVMYRNRVVTVYPNVPNGGKIERLRQDELQKLSEECMSEVL